MGPKRWTGIAAAATVVLLGAGAVVASLDGAGPKGSSYSSGAGSPTSAGEDLTLSDSPEKLASPVPDELARSAPDAARSAGGSAEADTSVVGVSSPIEMPGVPTRVVKTATLSLDVKRGRLDDVYASVLGTVESSGGFVASTDQSRGRAQLTVRIPAARFESTLATFRVLGKVTSESVSGEDVTAQYVDLESRLRNLRAQEVLLLDLMRRAETIQDSIAVQQQLSAVTQQVEQLEGQRRLLDDQSGFATLTLGLAVAGAPAATPAPPSTLAAAWEDATGVALDVIGGTLVVLGVVLPLAVIAALVGLPVWWVVRRRNPRPIAPTGSV